MFSWCEWGILPHSRQLNIVFSIVATHLSVDKFCVIPSLPPLLGAQAAHPHQGYPVKQNKDVLVYN